MISCFFDNFSLRYDKDTKQTKNSPGVEIRPKAYGDTIGIEYLHMDWRIGPLGYFAGFIEVLESVGYVRNVSIRGVPYDFRKAPNENLNFNRDLRSLIEETVRINDNTKAILVCHSMGCLYCKKYLK